MTDLTDEIAARIDAQNNQTTDDAPKNPDDASGGKELLRLLAGQADDVSGRTDEQIEADYETMVSYVFAVDTTRYASKGAIQTGLRQTAENGKPEDITAVPENRMNGSPLLRQNKELRDRKNEIKGEVRKIPGKPSLMQFRNVFDPAAHDATVIEGDTTVQIPLYEGGETREVPITFSDPEDPLNLPADFELAPLTEKNETDGNDPDPDGSADKAKALTVISGVGESRAKVLVENGMETADDALEAFELIPDKIAALDGFTEYGVQKIREDNDILPADWTDAEGETETDADAADPSDETPDDESDTSSQSLEEQMNALTDENPELVGYIKQTARDEQWNRLKQANDESN